MKKLHLLGELPALLVPAHRAREIAEETLAFFGQVMFDHHTDEERDLFPLVARHAASGEESQRVLAMNQQLTREHREIEAIWQRIEPEPKRAAHGQIDKLAGADVEALVAQYVAHAQFEERAYLPLAQTVLARSSQDLGQLGLSLHRAHWRQRMFFRTG